jgi:hypothetical protein
MVDHDGRSDNGYLGRNSVVTRYHALSGGPRHGWAAQTHKRDQAHPSGALLTVRPPQAGDQPPWGAKAVPSDPRNARPSVCRTGASDCRAVPPRRCPAQAECLRPEIGTALRAGACCVGSEALSQWFDEVLRPAQEKACIQARSIVLSPSGTICLSR